VLVPARCRRLSREHQESANQTYPAYGSRQDPSLLTSFANQCGLK